MPRIRTIKPEIWSSLDFNAIGPCGQLAFIALITNADDEGRLKADALHIQIHWLRGFAVPEVEAALSQMEAREMLLQYGDPLSPYVALTNWLAHQKVDHPKASQYPPPPSPKARRNGARTRNGANGTVPNSHRAADLNGSESPESELKTAPEPSRMFANVREESGSSREASSLVCARTGPDLTGPDLTGPDLTGPDLTDHDGGTAPEPPVKSRDLVVHRVFQAWRMSTGHTRAKLAGVRRRKIEARLAEGYLEADLIDAVQGWRLDTWADRPDWNDIKYLLADGPAVEKFRDLQRHGPSVVALPAARGATREAPGIAMNRELDEVLDHMRRAQS